MAACKPPTNSSTASAWFIRSGPAHRMLLAGGASFEVWGLAVVGEQVGGIGAGPFGTVRPVGLLGAAADVEGDLAVGELGDLGDEQRLDGPARPASDGACRRLLRPAAHG